MVEQALTYNEMQNRMERMAREYKKKEENVNIELKIDQDMRELQDCNGCWSMAWNTQTMASSACCLPKKAMHGTARSVWK